MEDQTDLQLRSTEIVERLLPSVGIEEAGCLDLDEDDILDHDVRAELADRVSAIVHPNRHLASNEQSVLAQYQFQRVSVYGFQEAESQPVVYVVERTKNPARGALLCEQ